ncbi:MAG: hypothetical protein JRE28_12520 [Deltaproteobacteria bacterium]|nr:hypothetical protein [Deltaproteobacteria bacterium]
MGRAWRIEYEGALYHLMSRGNNGQNIYLNDADRNLFLETISEMKAAKIVQIDIDKCVHAKRLHGIDKHKRDLIIYFLWNKGITTNEKIGRLFNMSSAISHCVKIFNEKMDKDKKVKNQFERLILQCKL